MDSPMIRFSLAWLLLAGVLACWVPSAQGAEVCVDPAKGMPPSAQPDLPAIIKQVQASDVLVLSYDKRGVQLGEGGGFFISPEGDIVTSCHVLQGAYRAKVRDAEGRILPLQWVVAEDREGNLIRASVQIPRGAALTLSLSPPLPVVDQPVMVIGSPLGLEPTVAHGTVSAVWAVERFGKLVQIGVCISPGSSGSPVVNTRGEVVGMTTVLTMEGCNLVFMTPAGRLKALKPGKGRPITKVKPCLWNRLMEYLESGKAEDILGPAFLCAGSYEQALAHLVNAAKNDPQNAEIHCRLGDCYYHLHRYPEAKQSYQQAIRLNPNLALAHYGLGMVCLKLGIETVLGRNATS